MILFAIFLTFVLTLLGIMVTIRLARRYGILDKPNDRKVHTEATPRLAGIPLFLITFLVFLFLALGPLSSRILFNRQLTIFFIGGGLLFGVGVLDDLFFVKARYKLVVQLFVSFLVVACGLYYHTFSLPFTGIVLHSPWIGRIVTFVFIVGAINALNFIDGMDGLCGGVSLLALAAMGVLTAGAASTAYLLSLLLIGGVAGFLFFNRPPARIFLGDTGSTMLGYTLSLLLLLTPESPADRNIFFPIVLLFIPLTDTLIAMVRRIKAGVHVFRPDRKHIHHLLLERFRRTRFVLLVLYTVQALLGAGVLLSMRSEGVFLIYLGVSLLYAAPLFFLLIYWQLLKKGDISLKKS